MKYMHKYDFIVLTPAFSSSGFKIGLYVVYPVIRPHLQPSLLQKCRAFQFPPSSSTSFITTYFHLIVGLSRDLFSVEFLSSTVRSNGFWHLQACPATYLVLLLPIRFDFKIDTLN